MLEKLVLEHLSDSFTISQSQEKHSSEHVPGFTAKNVVLHLCMPLVVDWLLVPQVHSG